MSYGYGVRISDYALDDPQKILDLLEYAPNYKAFAKRRLEDYIADNPYIANVSELTVNDFAEALADYRTFDSEGLHCILCEVINEAEGIELITDEGEWDLSQHYLLMEICVPWNMPDWEKKMSCERMTDIFKKYLGILFSGEIRCNYYYV